MIDSYFNPLTAQENFLLGLQCEKTSQWDIAFEKFNIAAQIYQKLNASCLEVYVRALQARLLRNKGEIKKAIDHIKCTGEALREIPERSSKWYVQVTVEIVWGTLCQKLPLKEDREEAVMHFEKAIDLSKKLRTEFGINSLDILSVDFQTIPRHILTLEIDRNIAIAQINIASTFLYEECTDDKQKQASLLADAILNTAKELKDWQLLGGGSRIKGEVAFRQGDLHNALNWFDNSLFAYRRGAIISPETFAEVENRIMEIEKEIGMRKWEANGLLEKFKCFEKIPKLLVLIQRPFLRGLDKRASAMPTCEAWRLYFNAAYWWDDAGWRDRSYQYLTKAVMCLDYIRDSIPLKGSVPSERRYEFYGKQAQVPLEYLIRLLLSSEANKIKSLSSPVSEAFYYREKLGAIGFLDELAESNTLSDLVTASAKRTGQFEQLKQLQETNRQLNSVPPQQIRGRRGKTVHALEDEHEKINKLYEGDLELRDLVIGDVCRLEEIQQLLPEDTALIEYVFTDSLFAAFVITHNGYSVPIFECKDLYRQKSSLNHEELKKKILGFIKSIGHREATVAGVPQQFNLSSIKEQARLLYNELLRPIEKIWDRGGSPTIERLIIIPQGILHMLPFSALFDGEKFVAEKLPTIQSPSASVLRHCYQKRTKSASTLTYFGFANPESDLEGCENVVLNAAKKFGFDGNWQDNYLKDDKKGIFVVRREAATYSVLLDNIKRYAYIDLETHGEFSTGKPLRQGFLVKDDDGTSMYLTAREIYLKLRMCADLLVAAMCNSGQVDLHTGDELVGLVRAFMFAGCRSILVYPWILPDEAAEIFLKAFYGNLIGLDEKGVSRLAMSKDKALQLAQISLIEQGRQGQGPTKSNREYKLTWEHPYYWAWTLIGDHV